MASRTYGCRLYGSLLPGYHPLQASLVLELFRAFTSALLAVTAASPVLPELSSLPVPRRPYPYP